MKRADEEPTPEAIDAAISQDPLRRHDEVERFLQMLLAVEPPYTILVNAPWGSGKTFFIKQAERVLRMANPALEQDAARLDSIFGTTAKDLLTTPFLPIYFNAWEDDHFDNPILPILATIATSVNESTVHGNEDLKKCFGEIIETAISMKFGLSLNVNNIIEGINGVDFLASYKEEKQLRSRIDELVGNYLPGIANRAVIFIDELDRCRPEFAVKVLEQAKTLFQQDNIVVVYSTDISQLANSLEGVYGPNFDGVKYLERFYDKRIELNPVKPADYLSLKGVNTKMGYVFVNITIELLNYKKASLRACNRLAVSISELLGYILNYQTYYGVNEISIFPKQCLLPVLNVLAYYEPLSWYEVRAGRGYDAVYEFARHSELFIKCLDSAIEEAWGSKKGEFPYNQGIENRHKRFIEDLCALIYTDDRLDPRIAELNNDVQYFSPIDQALFHRLTPPSD
ncbi:KAP family P-loop NTPase fold protein [Hominenteromicrobium sp.]|uniref:KAP family P-loop NTPase fold protein n=1 Tax=Hominenteromicrobium sp. TaxID=3073581 RepID=UPI003A8D9F2A